ncbi:MAG: type III pantothenate kinase [Metamycoplasmataceae bacterium]
MNNKLKKKDNLYISIGNTRTTFAIFGESIHDSKKVKIYTKDILNNISNILNELKIDPKKIFLCSVVEKYNNEIIKFFNSIEVIFLNYSSQNIINLDLLDNQYEIGNDMIATAIYAQSIGKSVVVVSLGTATTISAVVNKSIIGCIIFPGLKTSYDALIDKTMIPNIELESTKKVIGKNTKDALSIGIIEGHKIVIQELSNKLEMPSDTIYLYTGGNAHYIKLNDWKYIEDIDVLGLYLFSINR